MASRIRQRLDEIVENSLKGAAICDEVKDRLKKIVHWDFRADSSRDFVLQEPLR